MSDCNYGSISTSEYEALVPIDNGRPTTKRSALVVALVAIFVAGVVVVNLFGTDIYPSNGTGVASTPIMLVVPQDNSPATELQTIVDDETENSSPEVNPILDCETEEADCNFPCTLMKLGGVLNHPNFEPTFEDQAKNYPNFVPTNTIEAKATGWFRSKKDCDEVLGEEWLYGGVRNKETSATIYFTPEIDESTPGVVTAIEVDYYGYVPQNLIEKEYFTGPHGDPESEQYYSLAVLLRKPDVQGVCDTTKRVTKQKEPYVAIAPNGANEIVPIREEGMKETDWTEGACIPYMGYHWAKDLKKGEGISGEVEDLVPIQPMYNGCNGSINGIFFLAVGQKQTGIEKAMKAQCWPPFVKPKPALRDCFVKGLNFWDSFPLYLNRPDPNASDAFKTNFCGNHSFTVNGKTEVKFTFVTTMHFLFKDTMDKYWNGKYQCDEVKEKCRKG